MRYISNAQMTRWRFIKPNPWRDRSSQFKQSMLSAATCLFLACAGRWVYCDLLLYWWTLGLIFLLALQVLCFLMADYYRRKLERIQVGGYHLGWSHESWKK